MGRHDVGEQGIHYGVRGRHGTAWDKRSLSYIKESTWECEGTHGWGNGLLTSISRNPHPPCVAVSVDPPVASRAHRPCPPAPVPRARKPAAAAWGRTGPRDGQAQPNRASPSDGVSPETGGSDPREHHTDFRDQPVVEVIALLFASLCATGMQPSSLSAYRPAMMRHRKCWVAR